MLVESVLNTPAVHKRYLEPHEDFPGVGMYAPEEHIMCDWSGDSRSIPDGNSYKVYHFRKYITLVKLTAKDIVDGQVVISSNPIKDFRGNVSHYESRVGDMK
jgi:hypothetical protein